MIVKREKYYQKKDGIYRNKIKRVSYWLFGIIPLYFNNTIYERKL